MTRIWELCRSEICHLTKPLMRGKTCFSSPSSLTSVCWGTRSVLGETLWVCPCSRRGELLLTWAQSDVEVVWGSCGTGHPDLCPGLQTQLEWESKKIKSTQEEWEDCETIQSKNKNHTYTQKYQRTAVERNTMTSDILVGGGPTVTELWVFILHKICAAILC